MRIFWGMASEKLTAAPPRDKLPVFPIACWALGMMASAQLLVAGLALATRFEETRTVKIVEKEVTKIVTVPVPSENVEEASVVARPPAMAPSMPFALAPPVEPEPVETPQIADPRSERLVNEGRKARVAGDMGLAIIKLEESLKQSPEDPSVHYELGLVHEAMGVFDVAAEHYEKVFQAGVSGAGALYELAAAKLRDGFEQPTDMLGKLALGRVRIFNDPQHEKGARVILTIPLQKAPAAEVDSNEIQVSVAFFNRTSKGEIVPLEDKSQVSQQWVSLPFDWAAGEENLRMTYVIQKQDPATATIFGESSYYGQVVSLLYQGEVLDVQAWPRDLAARINQQPVAPPQNGLQTPEFLDLPPPDFDLDSPGVLPPR
jgi:hypothetical protein